MMGKRIFRIHGSELPYFPLGEYHTLGQSSHLLPTPTRMRTLLFLSLSLILFPTSATAQRNSTPDPRVTLLDSMFQALYQAGQVNGNVLIAEEGQILYENSFGLANEADSIPLNLETMFELTSVSKQFTAMGIVQLQKAGKLSLQDDIRDHLPELDHYEGITIQHLLTPMVSPRPLDGESNLFPK